LYGLADVLACLLNSGETIEGQDYIHVNQSYNVTTATTTQPIK